MSLFLMEISNCLLVFVLSSEIPDKNFFLENEAQENERPDTQSRFEQGRWNLSSDWILGLRGELLRSLEKAWRGVFV